MCGIIGMIGKRDSVGALIAGLDRLAYRGYDSAGLAVITDHGIDRRRAEGKIDNLRARLHAEPLLGPTGIGHTRWATHGIANEQNAHPHATSHVALVHNGIIENYRQIRAELQTPGDLTSDTDSEVIAHFLQDLLESGSHPIQAVQHLQSKLEGAFAFVFMFSKYPELLIGIRRGSALAVGYGDGEMYIGSDALALAHLTRQIAYLEEGDLVVLSRERAEFYDAGKMPAQRPIVQSTQSGALTGKGNYRHYMLKEIHEQPVVIGDLLSGLINLQSRALAMAEPPFDAQKAKTMTITACGTACYAGLIGSYWLEQCARLRCCVDTGSEFRYRNPPLDPGQPGLFISQSGETMDTLEAMRLAKAGGLKTTAIVNVVESSIAREADQLQAMLAGPEIGVASTKAFTAMLVSLAALSLDLARIRGTMSTEALDELVQALCSVPGIMSECLLHEDKVKSIADVLHEAENVLYLGRGPAYALALEGALKLKEISYIHAEGHAAGEMKHGPIALLDEHMPVVVLAPYDGLFAKTLSNMREASTRHARIIFISNRKGIEACLEQCEPAACFEVPDCHPFIAPIIYALPVQLLAYYTALLKGTDIDQPRNLAKSVTVE